VTTLRSIEWINAGAALLALALSTRAAFDGAPAPRHDPGSPGWQGLPEIAPVTAPGGGLAIADSTGTLVPLKAYRRIVSGSILTDPLLLSLCSPEQIVAFSAGAARARDAFRYTGKPSLDATRQLEQVLTLQPDLVLVNSLGEPARVQRLRDSGLVVFDLGPMWGVRTFLANVITLGWLLGKEDLARELAGQWQARLRAIARHIPAESRRSALYVSVQGNQLYGGTLGSSFHDVLDAAGLVDVAASSFRGWPSYEPEQLLLLDPELVVTQTGMRSTLCARAPLDRLKACKSGAGVIEIEPDLLDDAGLGMLDAAERIHAAAYPAQGAP
jgi:iron complex transport system substrate-binding protein